MNEMSTAPSGSPQQLRYWVASRLRQAILDGELKPGEWLRQERLAQTYDVSQMPVREALKQLAGEGLVEHVPYRGVRVVEFSAQDVADLYAHRAFLEGRAARAAAEHISAAQLAELQGLLDIMRQRMDQASLAEYRHLNRKFHQLVAEASQRAYLVRTLEQLWCAFPNMLWNTFASTAAESLPERDATDIDEHAALLAALAAHNPEAAERLARAHIEAAAAHLDAVLRRVK